MNLSKWQKLLASLFGVVSWKPKNTEKIVYNLLQQNDMNESLSLTDRKPSQSCGCFPRQGCWPFCFPISPQAQSISRGGRGGGASSLPSGWDGPVVEKVSGCSLSGPQTAALSPALVTEQADSGSLAFLPVVTVSCQPHFFLATIPWLVPRDLLWKFPLTLNLRNKGFRIFLPRGPEIPDSDRAAHASVIVLVLCRNILSEKDKAFLSYRLYYFFRYSALFASEWFLRVKTLTF